MSLIIKVMILLTIEPKSQYGRVHLINDMLNIRITRRAPYLPNFNKRPAKIIEPLVLASTWALGSQKCNPMTGIFTKKGIIKKILSHLLVDSLPLRRGNET